jgi:hypothetical protein
VQSDSSQHLTTKEDVCQLHARELPKVRLCEGVTPADYRKNNRSGESASRTMRSWFAAHTETEVPHSMNR